MNTIKENILKLLKDKVKDAQAAEALRQDTKFHFAQILFEITRKCNLKCAHCLRGEMQPISMSKEVIDKMLSITNGIDEIFLTGGEPFLEPSLIEYLVDRIIELDYDTKELSVITNGTILNDNGIRCARAFDRFAQWRKSKDGEPQEWYAHITVSNDDFHGANVDEAVAFYKQYAPNVSVIIQEYNGEDEITPYGRAYENHLSDKTRIDYDWRHRLRIDEGNIIPCILGLSYDGYLYYYEACEWTEVDKDINRIGNIMKESLVDMLERNQWEELRCGETKMIDKARVALTKADKDSTEWRVADWVISSYEKIKGVRSRIHKALPYLDYSTVCYAADTLMELHTGEWMKFVYKDYKDYKDKKVMSEESMNQYLENCIANNRMLRVSGAPKIRQVPYDATQERFENCEF